MVGVPFCRCRVLYIGSAVPTITKDGLQGIQQPLRERYPIEETADTKGIDSWLSVWSNGILLEYIDGDKKTETAFHPINSLHYCAAVRYVNVSGYAVEGGGERFLPLDSPFANNDDTRHPPIFAAIFRRTTGVKVLECHAFICTNTKAANALVRCCFHAYAESMYVKLEERIPGLKAIKEASRSESPHSDHAISEIEEISPNDEEREQQRWAEKAIGKEAWERRQQSGEYDSASISSSIVNRFKHKRTDSNRLAATAGQGALIPYNPSDPYSRRAGSDVDLTYGGMEPPMAGMYGGFPPPFRGGPFPPSPPHMLPPHPMMRPPFFAGPHPPPPMPPPMHMMPLGMPPPPRFPPGMLPPPGVGMMHPRFGHPPFGHAFPPAMGRPRTPTDGPIITGPESVYGTLPRRPAAFEEPIYMPGNTMSMPPQASYQPSSYPTDHYDAYYDTFKTQRSPQQATKDKSVETCSRRGVSAMEQDEGTQFWDAYEAGIYRKPHINEKAFSATVRSTSSALHDNTVITEADVIRPETPPADYETAFESLNINDKSNANHQQRTTAVMY